MASAKKFFTIQQQEAIKKAITSAEENTSGEIWIHIEENCPGDPVQCAAEVFTRLKMHKTKLHNAVLFYLAVEDKKFAIVGDSGIHAAVPDNFWDHIKDHIQHLFKEGKFTEGLCEGLEKAGEQLKKHFPHKHNDVNELTDDVSFGK